MKKKMRLPDTRKNRNMANFYLQQTHPAKVIILMSNTVVHAVTAVLDMPFDFHGRADRAELIITKCTANPNVTIAGGVITAALAKLTAYNDAVTGAVRDAYYPALHNTLKSFMALFQDAANNDIANAIVIIESGGFKVKNMAIPQKHEFKAENGAISGDVDLNAEGGPAGSVHNWKWSADGVTYTWLRGTSTAHTMLATGLAKGHKAYFIHELSIHDVPQTESQVFEIIIT